MAYENRLREIVESDQRFVVMTAENRAAIRNLPTVLGKRFVDTGITEQTMIGMAAGLALRGRVPVAHALATFLTLRAFEFIRTDVGIANLPVKLVGAVPGLLSEANGPTHQALEDVAIMRGIPGMAVYCPADAADMDLMLHEFLHAPGPAYLRFNGRAAAIDHETRFSPGRAECYGRGRDVAIVTYGTLFTEALEAQDHLSARGIDSRVYNLRTMAPIDERALVEAAHETKLVVTVEDHFLVGGLYSALAEAMLKHRMAPPSLAIGFDARWFQPGRLTEVMKHERMDGRALAERIAGRLMEERRNA